MPSGFARRIAVSTVWAVLSLVLLALAWRYLAPAYNRALAILAEPLGPSGVALQAEGMELVLRYLALEESGPPSTRVHGLTLHAGPLLVTALILATPACAWRRRLLGAAGAWLAFLVINAGSVALLSWGLAWTMEGGAWTLARLAPVMPLAYVGLPAVVGAAWCFKHWLPGLSHLPQGSPRHQARKARPG